MSYDGLYHYYDNNIVHCTLFTRAYVWAFLVSTQYRAIPVVVSLCISSYAPHGMPPPPPQCNSSGRLSLHSIRCEPRTHQPCITPRKTERSSGTAHFHARTIATPSPPSPQMSGEDQSAHSMLRVSRAQRAQRSVRMTIAPNPDDNVFARKFMNRS